MICVRFKVISSTITQIEWNTEQNMSFSFIPNRVSSLIILLFSVVRLIDQSASNETLGEPEKRCSPRPAGWTTFTSVSSHSNAFIILQWLTNPSSLLPAVSSHSNAFIILQWLTNPSSLLPAVSSHSNAFIILQWLTNPNSLLPAVSSHRNAFIILQWSLPAQEGAICDEWVSNYWYDWLGQD